MFNPKQVKDDFPVFYHNPKLTYLDSAATSLKPLAVIEKVDEYYKKYPANIHRGIYKLSEKASEEYEEARKVISLFLHANRPEEIVFTRNATEAINLIASTMGLGVVGEEDEIVTTVMEHHANFVPWQQLTYATGGVFKVIDVDEDAQVRLDIRKRKNVKEVITDKTKIFAITLVSNTLGTINPAKEIIAAVKKANPDVITVVDAAQAVPHMKVDVQDLGCDFLVFSSHKMLGPTGVGVLWGKHHLLEKMPPYQYGGDMISEVSIAETTFAEVPSKFEAGTPHIAGVIGLKEAIAYLQYYGQAQIREHEEKVVAFALEKIEKEFGDEITVYGTKDISKRAGIITFTMKGVHPHDIAQVLDQDDIAVRAGHHCTMPLHTALEIPASTRASFYLYNDEEDVEKFVQGLKKVRSVFKKQ